MCWGPEVCVLGRHREKMSRNAPSLESVMRAEGVPDQLPDSGGLG